VYSACKLGGVQGGALVDVVTCNEAIIIYNRLESLSFKAYLFLVSPGIIFYLKLVNWCLASVAGIKRDFYSIIQPVNNTVQKYSFACEVLLEFSYKVGVL